MNDTIAIDTVIAREIDTWLTAPRRAARIYAEGLADGTITAITDLAEWENVSDPECTIVEVDVVEGYEWTIEADAWQIGIGSIHGLADGVIECAETGQRYGLETGLSVPWMVRSESLVGTGLTIADVATAFTGDLLAAAHAFLRACEMSPIR